MAYLVGFIIAMAVGLTGVGAGSITAPVLILFFAISPADAVGTALIYGAVIKVIVAPMYLWRQQVNARVLTLLCLGGIPGVLLGSYLMRALDVRHYEKTLFVILGLTIAATALYSLYRTIHKDKSIIRRERPGWLPVIGFGIGTEVGFSSAGSGALGSLALLNLTRLMPAQVVGTDMLFGLAVSVIGGGFNFTAGHYASGLLWKLIAGGVAGVLLGANLSAVLPARPLRMALSVWLSFIGLQLAWRGVF
ncbi:MAG TPA: sulfite exporter TauE/SafE family protein [Bryobacteraceae bacterium]|nr:sulfite exporter TauE/SafE family protein [Bryobacteraceae bacterium]